MKYRIVFGGFLVSVSMMSTACNMDCDQPEGLVVRGISPVAYSQIERELALKEEVADRLFQALFDESTEVAEKAALALLSYEERASSVSTIALQSESGPHTGQ